MYDGGVEEGVGIYSDINEVKSEVINYCENMKCTYLVLNYKYYTNLIEFMGKEKAIYRDHEKTIIIYAFV